MLSRVIQIDRVESPQKERLDCPTTALSNGHQATPPRGVATREHARKAYRIWSPVTLVKCRKRAYRNVCLYS